MTVEDIYNATAMTYPAAYRMTMSGEPIKEILEDVADNLFNPDPYYQQGGDMVRCGGMGYTIERRKPMGSRIANMTPPGLRRADRGREGLRRGRLGERQPGHPGPAGRGSVVERHVARLKTVRVRENRAVKVVGA